VQIPHADKCAYNQASRWFLILYSFRLSVSSGPRFSYETFLLDCTVCRLVQRQILLILSSGKKWAEYTTSQSMYHNIFMYRSITGWSEPTPSCLFFVNEISWHGSLLMGTHLQRRSEIVKNTKLPPPPPTLSVGDYSRVFDIF
jgi:hypothetical protein